MAEEERPNDSSYLFNADALAVLQSAPTLNVGMDMLSEAYNAKAWDDPKAAKEVASDYAQQLRHRFGDNGLYNEIEIGRIEPIKLHEVQGEGSSDSARQIDQVNKWEQANKDFLAQDTSADYVLVGSKLSKSIEKKAEELRRYATFEGKGALRGAVEDLAVRGLQGATEAPAKLLGLTSYTKALEEHTDPSYDDDYGTAIASGLGTLAGATVSALGGPVGVGTYLGATGAGQVRSRYQQSLETSGDESKALYSAGIETGAQALQLGVAGKVLAPLSKGLLSKVLGKEITPAAESLFSRIVKPAGAQAAAQGVAGEISAEAQAVGNDTSYQFDPRRAAKNTTVGAVFGAGAGIGDVAVNGVNPSGRGGSTLTQENAYNHFNDVTIDPTVTADPIVVNGGVPPREEVSIRSSTVDDATQASVDAQRISEAVQRNNEAVANQKLMLSSRFGEIESTISSWNQETSQAAYDTLAKFKLRDLTESKIERRQQKLEQAETPEAKQKIQEQIDEYQKDLTELNDQLQEGKPGVAEAQLLQEKKQVADTLKPLRTVEEIQSQSVIPEINIKVSDAPPASERLVTTFDTSDGSQYVVTSEGATTRLKPVTEEKFHPMDRTFFVDKDTAAVLGVTRDNVDGSGATVRLLTDGEKLWVKNGSGNIEVETLDGPQLGAHPIEVNSPRATADNKLIFQSHIGQEITQVTPGEPIVPKDGQSVGAASLYDTRERAASRNIRTNPKVDEAIRSTFGDAETGLDRYFPQPNIETRDNAGRIVSNKGVAEATRDFLNLPDGDEHANNIAVADRLASSFAAAARQAKAAGDIEGYYRASDMAAQILAKKSRLGTGLGQGVQAFAMTKVPPDLRAATVRGALDRKAIEDTARSEGISVDDVRNVDKQLTPIEERIADIEKKSTQEPDGKKTVPEELQPELKRLTKERSKLQNTKKKLAQKKNELQESFTSEEEQKLTKLAEIAETLPEGSAARAGVEAKIAEIEIEKLPNSKNNSRGSNFVSYYISNIISGFGTLAAKIRGDETQILTAPASMALGGLFEPSLKSRQAKLSKVEARIEELRQLPKRTAKQESLLDSLSQQQARMSADLATRTHSVSRLAGFGAAGEFIKKVYGSLGFDIANFAANPTRQGFIDSIGSAYGLAANTFLTGKSISHIPDFKGDNYRDFVLSGPKIGIGPFTLNKVGYSGRAISAITEAFSHANREAQFAATQYYAAKKLGLSGRELDNFVLEAMHNSKAEWQAEVEKARATAKELKSQGIEWSARDVRAAAWEAIRAKREPTANEDSQRYASYSTFVNGSPPGLPGAAANLLKFVANIPIPLPDIAGGGAIRPAKLLVPFTNIGANIANQGLNFLPVGALRGFGFSSELVGTRGGKLDFRQKSEMQRRIEVGSSLVGAAAFGTIMAAAYHFKDDKDPWFMIYGPGETSAEGQAQMRAAKVLPYSLKFGDTYIHTSETPLMFVTGILGTWMDRVRNSKTADEHITDRALAATFGALGAFTDHTFMKSLQTIIKVIEKPEGTSFPHAAWQGLQKMATDTAKGFIPGSGLLRSIALVIDNPIDTRQGLWANFISGVPFVQRIGTKPALNVFGEPVEQTWTDRNAFVKRLFTTKTTDERILWLTGSGYSLPDIGNYNTTLSEKQNPSATARRIKEFGPDAAKHLSPEERYLLTQSAGPDISQLITSYAQRYGNSGYQQHVQDRIDADVKAIRDRWKRKLFLR